MYAQNRFDLPAIDNTFGPHAKASNRYMFVPTPKILDVLSDHGFSVVSASQGQSLSPYARHRVELTHDSFEPFDVVPGDTVNLRVSLFNGHNSRTGFCLHAGAYRSCCANGMVFGGKNTFANTIKFRHLGTFNDDFIEGVYRVIDNAKSTLVRMREMSQLQLTHDEQRDFTTKALALRWPQSSPVEVSAALQPRRSQDAGDSLWQVYQRVQESLIKGGMPGRTSSNRLTTVRALKSIDRNVKINSELFDLATDYLEHA